jgi:hypothetical protein
MSIFSSYSNAMYVYTIDSLICVSVELGLLRKNF